MLFHIRKTINDAVNECLNTPGAVLIDVREVDEYQSGHIPGAVNMPLSSISSIDLPNNKPLYLYCLRGTRSRRAETALKRMGYKNAKSIGGITAYKGQVVK
jgi:rhodanese-related sulfurtransferase